MWERARQVLECGEEKVLVLTEVERVKALAAQLVKLLRAQRSSSLPVSQLLTEYSKTFGYGLRLQDYDASTLPALLAKLCHVVKVTQSHSGFVDWLLQGEDEAESLDIRYVACSVLISRN